jgi:ADP-heptose:LPS heptosyltransferase
MDSDFKRKAVSKLNKFSRTKKLDEKLYYEYRDYLRRKFEDTPDTKFKSICEDKMLRIEQTIRFGDKRPKIKIQDGESVKVLFRQFQSPGDILTLTAGIRDLKKAYPHVQICMETSCGEIWENNPYLTKFPKGEADMNIRLEYPLVHKSNDSAKHFIHGFKEDIEAKLGVKFDISKFSCDLHLSPNELGWINQVEEKFGHKGKFWLINAGSKSDFPLKQWDPSRWQEVVDRLKHKITFVQVGSKEHNHEPLDGVLSLLGETDLRQLIRLSYHCEGALTHVSMLLHMMSAWGKPCVCVAGGRESAHWEAYNDTIYLDTVGQLMCCLHGACWKSKPDDCPNMMGKYPKCMNLITVDDVVNSIERYYGGGRLTHG